MSIFIIAEVGINHNGDLATAKKMIDEAKNAGVDCVKFQTFKAEEFVSDVEQTYTYFSQGKEVSESMLGMFKRYEFNKKEWVEIIEYCREKNILFSSTAQNESDLDFLLSLTELSFIKVGSDDLTNLALLKYYASKQIPMIISAGMAYEEEIADAINAIREMKNEQITVLHCVSSYPTNAHEVNLRKIPNIKELFNVEVGFSDHTIGSAAAIGAVCFGAKTIEKHFTLDNSMQGPDHWFSINPKELKRYVDDIRFIEKALGSKELIPTTKELEMRKIARRSIVANENLKVGDVIDSKSVTLKRVVCENALAPKEVGSILGKKVIKYIKKNSAIKREYLV